MMKRVIVLSLLLLAFLCSAMEAGACKAQQQFPIGLTLQYTAEMSLFGYPTITHTYDYEVVRWMEGVGYPIAEGRARIDSSSWTTFYFDVVTHEIYDSDGQPTSTYTDPWWIDLSDPSDGEIEFHTSGATVVELEATGGHVVTVPAGTFVCWRGYHRDTTANGYTSYDFMFESSYGILVKTEVTAGFEGTTLDMYFLYELNSSNMRSFIPLSLLRAIPLIVGLVVLIVVIVVILVVVRHVVKKRKQRRLAEAAAPTGAAIPSRVCQRGRAIGLPA